LYSRHKNVILNSIVPDVYINDPVVQKMINKVIVVLRGVDDTLFSKIEFAGYEKRGVAIILAFGATLSFGKSFRVGVVCGNASTQDYVVQLVANKGQFRSKEFRVIDLDDLRLWIEEVGNKLNLIRKHGNVN